MPHICILDGGSLLVLAALPCVWNSLLHLDRKFLAFDTEIVFTHQTHDMNYPGNLFLQIIQFDFIHSFSLMVLTSGLLRKGLSCWQLEVA